MKRYRFSCESKCCCKENSEGEYVKYEDVKEIIEENKILKVEYLKLYKFSDEICGLLYTLVNPMKSFNEVLKNTSFVPEQAFGPGGDRLVRRKK